jgi:hypothetical protein
VSAITAERDAAAARAETAERRLTAFTEFSGVLGTTESDVIDTFDAKYAAMPKADRPSRADWIKGLREKPESAPALLRPFLTTQAAEAAPGRPIGTMAGTGKKNEEAIPAECTAEWQRYGATLNISERDWFEKNWKPRHPPKKT